MPQRAALQPNLSDPPPAITFTHQATALPQSQRSPRTEIEDFYPVQGTASPFRPRVPHPILRVRTVQPSKQAHSSDSSELAPRAFKAGVISAPCPRVRSLTLQP